MQRCILHADCNCFYASVEMLHRPETRQVPLSDAAGWAEALLTAAASETTRDSGPEVCQRFSIDAVAAMIASYYKGEQP